MSKLSRFVLAILLQLGIGASACAQGLTVREVESVREMPNPSYHNPALGAAEVSSGGTAYFDDNVANASFQITTGPSRLVRFTIGGDTATTVTFYDDGDGTCSSNQRTPTHTSPSATIPGIYEVGMDFNSGICMLTAGGAGAADIGVVTLP